MRIRELFEDGRIVKGVNTTVDVGVNEIPRQAAKYGNRVTRDGFPPVLDPSGAMEATSYSRLELALMEGGHTVESRKYSFIKDVKDIELDEGWKERLAMTAKAGALGATALGGMATKGEYDKWAASQARAPTTISQPDTTSKVGVSATTKAPAVTPTAEPVLSKLAPKTSIRPQPKPDELKPKPPVRPMAHPTFDTFNPDAKLVVNTARKAGIDGIELAAFLAQVAHETKNFTDLIEDGLTKDFRKYDPAYAPEKAEELGNTNKGDGERYKGRGYIQLTGKANYQYASDYFGVDLVADPEMAAEPTLAAKIAVWFWKTRVRKNVTDFTDVEAVTRVINPGMWGMPERVRYFDMYKGFPGYERK